MTKNEENLINAAIRFLEVKGAEVEDPVASVLVTVLLLASAGAVKSERCLPFPVTNSPGSSGTIS